MNTIKEHKISNDPNVIAFRAKAFDLGDLYERKNHDYGDSFGQTFRELGIISAVTRMSDKMNRLKRLVRCGDHKVNDESIEDTLKDMASYAIMTLVELDKQKNDENQD